MKTILKFNLFLFSALLFLNCTTPEQGLNIETTLSDLLAQEDTDSDTKITVDDDGPRNFKLNYEGEVYEIGI